MESLDFMKKKAKDQGKVTNRKLHMIPYSKFFKLLLSKCVKNNVLVKFINPAYTSVIARTKYTKNLGRSVHSIASYVIGRRGQNFSERIPCKILDKVHSGQKHSDNLHDLNEWGKVHKQLKKCYPLLNENNGFSLRKSEIYLNSIARNDISRSFPSFLSKTCSAGKEKKTLNNIV